MNSVRSYEQWILSRKKNMIVVLFLGVLLLFSVFPSMQLVVRAQSVAYSVSYNPYANVQWGTWLSLKTELHDHTTQSDGSNTAAQMITAYKNLGFNVLGISDHDTCTWPWTAYGVDPSTVGMTAVPDEEVTRNPSHMLAPFGTNSLIGNSYATAQDEINAMNNEGALPIVAHPYWYGNIYKDETAWTIKTTDTWTGFQGIEIYNPSEGNSLQTFDFQLWDHILTDPNRAGQNHIWGFVSDDAHDNSAGDLERGWLTVCSPSNSLSDIETSLQAGSFLSLAYTSSDHTNMQVPAVNSITQSGSLLTVDTATSISWYANGQQLVGSSKTLDLSALPAGLAYVRAQLNTGYAYVFTQPIFITQSGSSGYSLTVNTVGSGSVALNPNQVTYQSGDKVYLSATPAAGWSFSGWSSNVLSDSGGSYVLFGSANIVVTATFTPNSPLGNNVVFVESGLPSGVRWSVTFNGLTQDSTGNIITFSQVATGSYSFAVLFAPGYSCSPSTGTVTVSGTDISQALTFTPYSAWDFEDHTYDHTDLTTLTAAQIDNEMIQNNNLFQSHGLATPQHLAYPNGAYNSAVQTEVAKYRLTGRIAGAPYGELTYTNGQLTLEYNKNPGAASWYAVPAVTISADKTLANIQSWVSDTVANKGLLVLLTHQVTSPPPTYGCTPSMLGSVLDYLVQQQNAGNLYVMSMRDAYNMFNGQKAVIILCFDDSYSTDYSVAWPLFQSHGLVGTSYVIGSLVGESDRLSWNMITQMAGFSGTTNQITVIQSANGVISPSTASYPQGSSQDETVTPNSGYYIASITVDGNSMPVTSSSGQVVSFNNIQQPHMITADFEQILYQITVTQTVHGTISPSTSSHPKGASQAETITPDSGYYISSITVDGASISVTSPNGQTANFNNIQGPHSITATYAHVVYTITVTQTSNGVISPRTTSYPAGASQDETVTPNSGYYIASITVDGNSVPVTSSSGQVVSFNNIQQAHKITATYSRILYTVTFTESGLPSGTQWSVTLNGATLHSTTTTITFSIASGTYSWSVSTPVSGTTGTRYVASSSSGRVTVTSATNMQIHYQTQYYLTMQTQGSGSTTPKSGWYNSGVTVQITANPNVRHSFSSWIGTGIGSYTGTARTVSIVMNSPIMETATFT